jgi:hypothetical protein
MRRLVPCLAVLITAAACSQPKESSSTCVPLATVAAECPPDWNAAKVAKDAFCAQQMPEFDAFFSTARCHDRLHFTRYLFDGGPRYCVYDPATLKLTGYGAFDGKAMFEQLSCGTDRAAFDEQGCAGEMCPGPSDGGTSDAADGATAIPDALPRPDRPASMLEVRCDVVDQDCPGTDACGLTADGTIPVIGCSPVAANAGKLGETCGTVDGGVRLCARGLGCFSDHGRPPLCFRFCRAGSACPEGTTCDTTTELYYGNGTVPAGICR